MKDTGAADHAAARSDAARDATGAKEAATATDSGAPPTPAGTALEKGEITLVGVTDDGHVIYQHGDAVKAIPAAGGAAVTLLDATDAAAENGIVANVVHDVVFLWSNVSLATGASTLTVWSSSLAKAATVSTSSVPSIFATSDDSNVIAFSDGTSADGASTNLVAATFSSLTTLEPLATGVDPGNQDAPTCPPALAFSGAGSTLHVVVGSCTPTVVDGGTDGPFLVTSFAVSSWIGTTLAPSATSFVVDDTGTSAAIFLPSGELGFAALAGGTPLSLGASPDAGSADAEAGTSLSGQMYLSPTDAFVLWSTNRGALFVSKVTSASVTMLATTGAVDLDGVSATGAFVLVDQGADGTTGFPEGLGLASTSTAGPVASLGTGDVFLNVHGDMFTADGNYALYLASATADGNGDPIGVLTAAPVATPGTRVSIAEAAGSFINPITGAPSNTVYALTGSQVAFVDSFDSSNGQAGQADIKVTDLSSGSAATTVMTNADPTFVVSLDKRHIVYTITFGGSTDGVYSVPVP